MLLVLFGHPGSGKTYAGEILKNHFGFYLHDGDQDLPQSMRVRLAEHGHISDNMRDEFFQNILQSVEGLTRQHKNIVVAQTFIKEKYRESFKEKFPHTQFMYISVLDEIREERLQMRTSYPLDLTYARQMVADFDKPRLTHKILDNKKDGEDHIKKQLKKIILPTND